MNINSFYQKLILSLYSLLMLGASSYIMAEDISREPVLDHFELWPRASNEELEQLRGGFILPNGIHIDLSLLKSIHLNGVETYSSFFQFPEDGLLSQYALQNLAPDIGASALSSVIQNHMDNQLISAVTELNITISNLNNLNLINESSRVITDFIAPGIR